MPDISTRTSHMKTPEYLDVNLLTVTRIRTAYKYQSDHSYKKKKSKLRGEMQAMLENDLSKSGTCKHSLLTGKYCMKTFRISHTK